MSSMAKVFVVVNLVLGVAAFGSAATLLGAKEDYKSANRKLTQNYDFFKSKKSREIEGLNKKLGDAQTEASQAKAAQDLAISKLSGLRATSAEANKRNTELVTAMAKMNTINENLTEANKNFDSWLKKYAAESGKATKEMVNAKNALQKEIDNRVRLEGEVAKTVEEREALAARAGQLDKDLRNAKFWLDKYRERFGDITGKPQGSSGVVKRVRGGLVSISVGTNDGVRVGDIYQIRRGSSYVGQVKITNVYKDQAVGEFDNEFKGPGAPPQAGDVAEPRRW